MVNSCATKGVNDTHLTESEVILIADRAAVKNGYAIQDYMRSAHFDPKDEHGTWVVSYDPKPGTLKARQLGTDFDVIVRDDSKETWLFPGR